MMNRTIIGAALTFLIASTAMAQDPSVPQRGQDRDPQLPPPAEQIPEKVQPETRDERSLSDKLESSDGVLKPPEGVEPQIKTVPPDPDPGGMPVIKPNGNAK